MEERIEKQLMKQKISIIVMICIVVMIGMIGFTYSFFVAEISSPSGQITGEVATPELNITVKKMAPTSPNHNKKLVPQLDRAITKAVVGTQGNCVDDNINAVCQVYKITLENASASSINVDGVVELNNGNNPNLKWARISGDGTNSTEPTVIGGIKESGETTLTINELYTKGEVKDYYIVVWISETGYAQADRGTFTGTVIFGNSEPLSDAATSIYSLGIVPKKDQLTILTTSSNNDGTTGVYKSEDDIGTSYYFRGNIVNNYVKFGRYTEDAYQIITTDLLTGEYIYSYASVCPETYVRCTKIAEVNTDMYWRILRINGDGSIRLIYDGTTAYINDEENKLNYIGIQPYNKNYNDNAYVGYMYGTIGQSAYDNTHANINNSDLKKTIDAWYLKYLNTNYSSSIVDAIYCNDRKVVTDDSNYKFWWSDSEKTAGNGTGTSDTLYGIFSRMTLNEELYVDQSTPSLKCEQENDRFTKNAVVNGIIGNGDLEYPIAAITADEMTLAGSYLWEGSLKSYLYESQGYWTLSPSVFVSGRARVFTGNGGSLDGGSRVLFDYVTRPSISIDSSVISGGTGTRLNPFIVS